MARYYLVPNEIDKEKMKSLGLSKAPSYLYEGLFNMPNRGVTDWNNTTGKEYYLIIVDDKVDMSELEKQTDVKKIDTTFLTKENVSSVLNVSIAASKPTRDELEKLVIKWLTGEEKTLREI